MTTPFIWTIEAGFQRLVAPPEYNEVQAVAINNEGTVLLGALRQGSAWTGFLVRRTRELKELPNAEPRGYTHYTDGWLCLALVPVLGQPAPEAGPDEEADGNDVSTARRSQAN